MRSPRNSHCRNSIAHGQCKEMITSNTCCPCRRCSCQKLMFSPPCPERESPKSPPRPHTARCGNLSRRLVSAEFLLKRVFPCHKWQASSPVRIATPRFPGARREVRASVSWSTTAGNQPDLQCLSKYHRLKFFPDFNSATPYITMERKQKIHHTRYIQSPWKQVPTSGHPGYYPIHRSNWGLNAASPSWGYNYHNHAGRTVVEFLNSQKLKFLYHPEDQKTFLHYSSSTTNPDLAMVSSDI